MHIRLTGDATDTDSIGLNESVREGLEGALKSNALVSASSVNRCVNRAPRVRSSDRTRTIGFQLTAVATDSHSSDWHLEPAICVCCGMSKPTKVVPIENQTKKAKMIAHDSKGHRIIIGIGSQRMALDFQTRITHLPPHTGDRPADVLPIKDTSEKSNA